MKKYLLFILLFASNFTFAQSLADSSFTLNKIPESGFSLDEGWKFKAGDNLGWAAINWNDSQWEKIQLSTYSKYLLKLKNGNIGCFRLHLLINSSTKKQLALQFTLLGASEHKSNLSIRKNGFAWRIDCRHCA